MKNKEVFLPASSLFSEKQFEDAHTYAREGHQLIPNAIYNAQALSKYLDSPISQ